MAESTSLPLALLAGATTLPAQTGGSASVYARVHICIYVYIYIYIYITTTNGRSYDSPLTPISRRHNPNFPNGW